MNNTVSCKNPIFVFSAGWRSGSTLLQRMITASREALIWGEAGGAINCFADALQRFQQMLGPGSQEFKHGYGGNGKEQFDRFRDNIDSGVHHWIASMTPPEERITESLRQAFDSIYGSIATELGYARWGLKEVQSGAETAVFLRSLYPDAKFVFLVRNPFHCLLSIKRRDWIDQAGRPDPLRYFASHWATLATEFKELDFGYKLRYEDLVQNEASVDELAQYLDTSDFDLNFANSSRADWNPINEAQLTWIERIRIQRILKHVMREWGYT